VAEVDLSLPFPEAEPSLPSLLPPFPAPPLASSSAIPPAVSTGGRRYLKTIRGGSSSRRDTRAIKSAGSGSGSGSCSRSSSDPPIRLWRPLEAMDGPAATSSDNTTDERAKSTARRRASRACRGSVRVRGKRHSRCWRMAVGDAFDRVTGIGCVSAPKPKAGAASGIVPAPTPGPASDEPNVPKPEPRLEEPRLDRPEPIEAYTTERYRE
jgi:hypothetical protein